MPKEARSQSAEERAAEHGELQEYLRTLIGSWKLVAWVSCGSVVLGLLYTLIGSPVYRADALIQVEDKKADLMGLSDLLGNSDDSLAQTEIELLYSRLVVGSVVRGLSLDIEAKPRYFPVIGGAFARAYHGEDVAPARLALSRFAWGGEQIAVERLDVPKDAEDEKLRLVAGENGAFALFDPDREKVIEGQVGKLARSADGRYVILVSRMRARPGTHFNVIKHPFDDLLNGLQNDLVINERGKKTGMIRVQLSGTDIDQVVRTLNAHSEAYVQQNIARKSQEAEKTFAFVDAQLPEVKARLEKAEIALHAYRTQHRTVDLSMETQAALDRAVEIEKGATELQLAKASLSERFTENHPALVGLRNKMAALDAARKALNVEFSKLPESDLYSVRLLRDVTVANQLYVFLLDKAQELKIETSGTIGNVRVVDQAVVPYRPAYPRFGPMLAISVAAGLLLGAGAVSLRRALNRAVEDPEVVEATTGLPVYASVAHSVAQERFERTRKKKMNGSSARILAAHDSSDLAIESLRSLRTSLQFALLDAPNRIITLGGPSPGIGKSFVASNLAHLLAESGKRTLLIDADLRNGSQNRLFELQRSPGLSELIAGTAQLDRCVHAIAPNLDLITCGDFPPKPSELLMSARYRELVERLEKQFELIVVDTPPVLAVTDATIVARLAGVNLLVLRDSHHPMREIQAALKHYQQTGARIAGFILNDVSRASAGSAYGYHYQYDYKSKKAI